MLQLNFKSIRSQKSFLYFQRFLTVIVVVVCLYIILAPIWPEIEYFLKNRFGLRQDQPIIEIVKNENNRPSLKLNLDSSAPQKEITGNRIVISKAGINMPVRGGDTDAALNDGYAWIRPMSRKPGQNGNVIITGHRFDYLQGSQTFYHLDKLKKEDIIDVYWDGKKHEYKVTETFIVTPDQVEVENQTSTETLTLYTCTPLWTSANRLVIRAKPV